MAIKQYDTTQLLRKARQLTNYRFRDRDLILAALTHPSYRFENNGVDYDYERLEFVGDAILDLVIAKELWDDPKQADEGEMTRRRSELVSGKNLAQVAAGIELGKYLRFGKGEAATGGANKDSILENALEALIGAVFLDGGYKKAARFILQQLKIRPQVQASQQNPKNALQELCHKMDLSLPEYKTVEKGPAHKRQYHATVYVDGKTLGKGKAGTRKGAEAAAAELALGKL